MSVKLFLRHRDRVEFDPLTLLVFVSTLVPVLARSST